jgi:RNA polymerase sigma-70 factor (ECF subfamily)
MTSPVPARAAAPAEDISGEHDLIDRALGGDGRAFGTLVKPHLAMLYRLSARATGDADLAEDAVQETLEIVFRKLRRYRAGTSFKSFVAAVAARRARTLIRAERRRLKREGAAPAAAAPATPADLASARQAERRVREALSRLPSKRQRVVLLRLDGELGYAEIAEAVGTTEGSARVLVHHALKGLAAELSDLLGKDGSR